MRRVDFALNLAPYNLHAFQQWQRLSGYISAHLISKLSPLPSGNLSVTAEADPSLLKPVTVAEQKLYTQLQEGRQQSHGPGKACTFHTTPLPSHPVYSQVSMVQVTRLSNRKQVGLQWHRKHPCRS